jgi:prepilin-type N-terminal cleavage/methylation domain-containing protein
METRRRTRVHRPSGDRGITLIELMIVLVILSLTTEAIFSLVYASLKTFWKGDAATQAQQGARTSTDRMMRDLRQARRLITGVTKSVGPTSVTINTGCTTPQVSFALPHLTSINLTDSSSIYATDPYAAGAVPGSTPPAGTVPYDGWYVSYYLAAASNSATPNTTGPYLIRASYDGTAITLATIARNVTGLALNPGGTCPTTSSREFTVQVTAIQNQTGQNVSSQTIITDDAALRDQGGPP